MRFLVLAALTFVASGCTIHLVEQPSAPTIVTEAPRVAVAPTPAPVVEYQHSATHRRVVTPPSRATDRPLRVATKPRTPPPSKPLRTRFDSVEGPEPRTAPVTHLIVPTNKPHKVKADEPVSLQRAASAGVAQAQ